MENHKIERSASVLRFYFHFSQRSQRKNGAATSLLCVRCEKIFA
jgi:hypothetical protein